MTKACSEQLNEDERRKVLEYSLFSGVWEITAECNMRCMHCGSSCEDKLEGELTTDEALSLCDELKLLDMKSITLSGGEPTLRNDWDLIAARLVQNGIQTNIITNAWFLDDDMLVRSKKAGVTGIAVSIDGMKSTHDRIRRDGSYEKCLDALPRIKTHGVLPAVITTVNSLNIIELDDMYALFEDGGVDTWQLQLALPMGNLKHNTSLFVQPEHVNLLIDFAHSKISGKMNMFLGDNVGYYNKKVLEIHQKSIPELGFWCGCTAGKSTIGILHNGDITGCASVRDKRFIEGNIKERSLRDIWNADNSFSWNRQMRKSNLKGLCAKCQFSNCLGGCSNSRLCMNNDIHSENAYCSYNIEMTRVEARVAQINETDKLLANAYSLALKKQFQSSEIVLSKLCLLTPDCMETKSLLGYVHFELGNYELSERFNRDVLKVDPANAYASKGLGLALCRQGQIEDGVNYMYQAINMEKDVGSEIHFDLFAVLMHLHRRADAMAVKAKAQECSDYSEWKDRFESLPDELPN